MDKSDLFERYLTDRSPAAMDRLMTQYWPMVLSVCRRYLAHPHDAEDAAQETFIKLMRHVDQVRGNVAAWLAATARTTSIDQLRRRRKRALLYDTQSLGEMTAGADAGGAAGWSMLLERLDEAIGSMDPWARELIVERFLRQTPLRVLAGRSGASVPTMSRRTGKALVQLSEVFADMGVEPPAPEAMTRWLRRVDPAGRAAGGHDGQGLRIGDWTPPGLVGAAPAGEDRWPEGWTRPIRMGVMMSWENWRRPNIYGLHALPEDTNHALRFLDHPGYELFAVVDPGTSDLGVVERTLRDYEMTGGLMHWNSTEELASLDVLLLSHTFWLSERAADHIKQAVRGGMGLYIESMATGVLHPHHPPSLPAAHAALCLAREPIYHYCACRHSGGHGQPRPMRVEQSHPIIDSLPVGARFYGPPCGLIFEPAPQARVLVAREDPVQPTAPLPRPDVAAQRIPVLLTGQIGDGRVVRNNALLGGPFHRHPALGGRFIANCVNWLAEPRRGQQA